MDIVPRLSETYQFYKQRIDDVKERLLVIVSLTIICWLSIIGSLLIKLIDVYVVY